MSSTYIKHSEQIVKKMNLKSFSKNNKIEPHTHIYDYGVDFLRYALKLSMCYGINRFFDVMTMTFKF